MQLQYAGQAVLRDRGGQIRLCCVAREKVVEDVEDHGNSVRPLWSELIGSDRKQFWCVFTQASRRSASSGAAA